MQVMHRWLHTLLLTLIAWGLLASGAGAHAVVSPRQVTTNAFEQFTLRVPTETPQPTVKVRLAVPEGVTISAVKPIPGWTNNLEKDAAGRITAITWSAGEIGPGQAMAFDMNGRTPGEPGKVAWKIQQTYKDGTVVAWDGPSGDQAPASIMEVKAAPLATAMAGPSTSARWGIPTRAGFVFGVIAMAVIALAVALLRRRALLQRRG